MAIRSIRTEGDEILKKKSKKDQELYQKRQLEIAKSLYELGVDDNIIQAITKIEMDQVLRFRNEKQSQQNKQNIDERP